PGSDPGGGGAPRSSWLPPPAGPSDPGGRGSPSTWAAAAPRALGDIRHAVAFTTGPSRGGGRGGGRGEGTGAAQASNAALRLAESVLDGQGLGAAWPGAGPAARGGGRQR